MPDSVRKDSMASIKC